MSSRRRNALSLIASLALLASPLRAEQDRGNVAYDFSAGTDLIQSAVDRIPLQGASLLLVKDGQVIYERAFGSYTLDTVVPIASASKWISASVVMSLVDDGLIDLDAPVSRYLPNFTGVHGTITMREAFSHTSGLPSEVPCLSDRSITLEECVDQISRVPLLEDPGTALRYGGVSMQVGGRVAEVVSGRSWNELFAERIKGPLQMAVTTYGLTDNPRIAGGAFSKLEEYGNLLQMHLNGGTFNGRRVLFPEAVREMQADQTFGLPIAYSPHPDGRGYGLGEWRDIVDDQDNAIQLSSQGLFGFSPWIDVQRNLLGVFLVNTELRNVYALVTQMQGMIRDVVDAGAPGR